METYTIKRVTFKSFQKEWQGMELIKYQDSFRWCCDELITQAQGDNATVTFRDISFKLLHHLLNLVNSPLCPERDFLDKGYPYDVDYDDEHFRDDIGYENVVWKIQGDNEPEDFSFNIAMRNDIKAVKLAVVTFVINYLLFRNCNLCAALIAKYLEDGKIMEECLAEADAYQLFCYKQVFASCPSGSQIFEKYCDRNIPL